MSGFFPDNDNTPLRAFARGESYYRLCGTIIDGVLDTVTNTAWQTGTGFLASTSGGGGLPPPSANWLLDMPIAAFCVGPTSDIDEFAIRYLNQGSPNPNIITAYNLHAYLVSPEAPFVAPTYEFGLPQQQVLVAAAQPRVNVALNRVCDQSTLFGSPGASFPIEIDFELICYFGKAPLSFPTKRPPKQWTRQEASILAAETLIAAAPTFGRKTVSAMVRSDGAGGNPVRVRVYGRRLIRSFSPAGTVLWEALLYETNITNGSVGTAYFFDNNVHYDAVTITTTQTGAGAKVSAVIEARD